jgi:hypothetical protein
MKINFLTLATAGLLALPSVAGAAIEDQQIWLTGSASVDLGGGFRLSEEMVARFGNDRGGLYELENNLLLGYKISKAVTLWAGYTHNPLYSAGRFTQMERRARQQITADNIAKIGEGSVSLRMRTEQRWRAGLNGTGWRVRPFVRYTLPMPSKTQLIVSHESMINLNTTPGQTVSGYDRMRNSISVKVPITKALSLETGYLNQYQFTRSAPNRMDHAATMTLGASF